MGTATNSRRACDVERTCVILRLRYLQLFVMEHNLPVSPGGCLGSIIDTSHLPSEITVTAECLLMRSGSDSRKHPRHPTRGGSLMCVPDNFGGCCPRK